MNFEPTPDEQAFIQNAIAGGRCRAPEEALHQAMGLWLEHERRRMEILAALDEAEADIAGGRFKTYEKHELPLLAEEIKRQGRELRAKSDK